MLAASGLSQDKPVQLKINWNSILSTSKTNPNFLGIPFPKTLASTQMMLTQ